MTVPTGMRRLGALVVVGAVVLGCLAATPATADTRPTIQPLVPLGGPFKTIQDSILDSGSRRYRAFSMRARPRASGGIYYTPAGEPVHFQLSSAYVPDDALTQQYVDFLGSLHHGSEISTVSIHVLAPWEMSGLCPGAVACYAPGELFIQGEPAADGTPISEALAHEYGHHIAASRTNDPFPGGALDWGTKRWASYENVCQRVIAHTAFPGDEGINYTRNPGEAFADSYRIANGGSPARWQYDADFYPDDVSLSSLLRDVHEPYSSPGIARTYRGRMRARGPRVRVAARFTALDGTVKLRLSRFGRLRATAYLVDPNDDSYLARSRGGMDVGINCGTPILELVVVRTGRVGGSFSVYVEAP